MRRSSGSERAGFRVRGPGSPGVSARVSEFEAPGLAGLTVRACRACSPRGHASAGCRGSRARRLLRTRRADSTIPQYYIHSAGAFKRGGE
eukprot:894198-Prorocentrum_minimum.AAC.2